MDDLERVFKHILRYLEILGKKDSVKLIGTRTDFFIVQASYTGLHYRVLIMLISDLLALAQLGSRKRKL